MFKGIGECRKALPDTAQFGVDVLHVKFLSLQNPGLSHRPDELQTKSVKIS